uniref:Ig-like domain-containing protein n=1 Tax=Anopheles culicifacies TaxID=139723 RepID=A0A182MAH5_9DIPT
MQSQAGIAVTYADGHGQSGEQLYIKVADLLPKFTFLGLSLDDALKLQNQHDELLRQIQNMPTPLEEFYRKIQEKIASNERPNPTLIEEMAASLNAVWHDIKQLLAERREIVVLNVAFFERLGEAYGKMSSLEVACNDTMIPIEIDAVREFLESFRDLRGDMLGAVATTLKAGQQMLDRLRVLSEIGTLDSRPNHIKLDAVQAIGQVEVWLEDLSNRRNQLEQAWISRKTQLEQCLTLAILAKQLEDIEQCLSRVRSQTLSSFTLGDSAEQAGELLETYQNLKSEAALLRDKSLKITKTTEELLTSGCFAGDEACAKAYSVLNGCSEHLEEIDHRESLLGQSRDFFTRAGAVLKRLDQLEQEVAGASMRPASPNDLPAHQKLLQDIRETIGEVLQMGYSLVDDVGRTKPEVAGVQNMIERIEQRKLHFERYCNEESERNVRTAQALNEFLERYGQLFAWLEEAREERLVRGSAIHRMGENLVEAKECLLLHHQFLNDLEIKGNAINNLLVRLTPSLEHLADEQRDDVQRKIDLIRQHWIALKNTVIERVDLLKLYIRFHQEAETLRNQFDAHAIQFTTFKDNPADHSLILAAIANIRQTLESLRPLGGQCLDQLRQIGDAYLQKTRAAQCVERTLAEFADRQSAVSNEWESWNSRRRTETTLKEIMAANMETMAVASKLEEQLYPIFSTALDNPSDLIEFIGRKRAQLQQDVHAAEADLTQRFDTIAQLELAGETGTEQDIVSVKNNLNSIKTKLFSLGADFGELSDATEHFLRSIMQCRDSIREYFGTKHVVTDPGSVDVIAEGYEQFKQATMEHFRGLLQQSEQIIERVKALEPPGARELDTDKIITLLENLRTYFESQTESENCELKKQHSVLAFDRELNEVRTAMRAEYDRLERGRGQYGESLSDAQNNRIAFEEHATALQELERRIDAFITSGTELVRQYPETSPYIESETHKLRNEWTDLLRKLDEHRQLYSTAIEYFELITTIEDHYRTLNAELINANNKLTILNNVDVANDLVAQVDNTIRTHETRQLDALKKIANLSTQLYGSDKTLEQEKEQQRLEQLKREQEQEQLRMEQLQREAARKEQEAVVDDVKITTTTSHSGLPHQQQSFDVQTIDEEQYLQEPQVPLVIQTVEEEVHEQIHEVVTTSTLSTNQPEASLRVIQPLVDVCVQEGQRVRLQCVVAGVPDPTIEWYKNGISVQGNPDYRTSFDPASGVCTLMIDETVTADSADILCRIVNEAGIADTTARLLVTEAPPPPPKPVGTAPTFTMRLLDGGVAQEGQPFQYDCVVSGQPIPTVHWYKADQCIDGSADYRQTYDPASGVASLRIEQVYLEDQTHYTCRAVNDCGSDETSVFLTVKPLEPTEFPDFPEPLSNVMARVGQKIRLEAKVSGTPQPELMWTHDGKHFTNREVKFFYENGRAQLVIDEAFLKDAGVYTLTAKNIAGEKCCSCNVVVKGRLPNETSDSELASDMEPVKPAVQLPLRDVSVFEGKPVRLDCVIVGQPEPEVIWYHGERPVKESTDFQLLFQGDRCSLVIREAFLEDAGEYRVVAINSAGEASSQCSVLVTPLNTAEPAVRQPAERVLPTVGAPPRFERLLSDILADEGERVQFECAVSGDPRPTIRWFVNNREIPTDVTVSPRVHCVVREDGVVKLIIERVMPDDKGVYTVKAANASGEAKCFSNLIVKTINAPEFEAVSTPAFLTESLVCPTFRELFADRVVRQHEPTKFECIVIGKPQPKIRWFFNDQPVQGHDFLVSTSGDRQVLTIPEVRPELTGKITCYAENEAGNAQCVAIVQLLEQLGSVGPAPMPELNVPMTESMQQVDTSGSSCVTLQKHVTTSSSSSYSSSSMATIQQNSVSQSHSEVHAESAKLDRSFHQEGNQAPQVAEASEHQRYDKVNDQPANVQHEASSYVGVAPNLETIIANSGQISTGKPARRNMAPRFVTPFNGKIVDQGADVIIEGIVDGYPTPEVHVTKNDVELQPDGERILVSYSLNKIVVELRNVSPLDAGRYTATASNAAGASTTTADLVVKKSIFPPVFGRRLQAQTANNGDRVVLDVEVSGTPEPTITWFKDGRSVQDALAPGSYALQQVGSCFKLIFEQITMADTGKYMVVAKNAGGEAQSTADIAVLQCESAAQPAPQSAPQKHVSFVDMVQQQQPRSDEVFEGEGGGFSARQEYASEAQLHGPTTESTIVTETRRTTEATMRMEHKISFPDLPVRFSQRTQTPTVPTVTEGTSPIADPLAHQSMGTNTEHVATRSDATQTATLVGAEVSLNLPPQPPPSAGHGMHNYPPAVEGKRVDFLKPQPETIPTPPIGTMFQSEVDGSAPPQFPHPEPVSTAPKIAVSRPTTVYRPRPSSLPEARARSSSPRPSADAIAMERLWSTPKAFGTFGSRTAAEEPVCQVYRQYRPPPNVFSSSSSFTKHTSTTTTTTQQQQPPSQQQQQHHHYSTLPFARKQTKPHQEHNTAKARSDSIRSDFQPIYQQPTSSAVPPTQMYSSFSSTQQFQASSTLAQQQYSQSSMQYQPFKPSLAVEAPVRAPSPAPVPTFVPSQVAPPPAQSFPPKITPFKAAPAPSMFTPAPAPAPAPMSVPAPVAVQPLNVAGPAPSCTLTPIAGATPAFLGGPSYNQTPQPFKPLPPPAITPSSLGAATPAAAAAPQPAQATYAPQQPQPQPQAYAPSQQAAYGELKAPRMVQGVRLPVAAPLPPDFGYGAIAELGLEPGPQPTMGYAPKASSERKSSYYREQIEQSLLESMDKEPERVPAGGVKIIPPSPRKKSKPSPPAVGQSDTAGGAPAPLEQPAELQQGLGAKTKSPFTATESEYESDLDGTGARRQNGYLADTEEVVQKTAAVSFEQQQTIESFSSSSKVESHSSVVSEVVQQQQSAQVEQQQVFQEVAQPQQPAEEPVQPPVQQQEQQQSAEEVIISSSETVQKETVEESKSSFLVNNDLPEDLQPVKVLPTEEPLPTLKHVPVPAAVQPVPEVAPAPEPAMLEPQPQPQPLQQQPPAPQQPEPIAPTPVQQNGYPTPSPAQPFLSDYESDAAAPSLAGYKPVHPVFAPPKQEFSSGPAAPPPSVFDPIDKIQANQINAPTDAPKIEKPKPISYVQQQQQQQQQYQSSYQQQQTTSFQQQSYQQQSYQQQQQQQQSFPPAVQSMPAQYYTSVTAQPVHNTLATETTNSLHMKEMTESSNRVVNMQQTKRVVSLEQQQQQHQQQSSVYMQKPGRFTPGEYRDSDGYDSDGTRIRPMWTPNPSDSDEPHYRSVRPNFQQSRSTSLPRQYERIQTPMEFDTLPVQMPTKIELSGGVESSQHQRSSSLSRQSTQIETTTTMTTETLKTQTLDRYASKRLATTPVPNTRDDMAVKAHRVAPINYIQKQADGMAQTFKTKAYHFNNEVMTDIKKTPIKPILKNAYGAPMAQPQPPQQMAQPQATAAPPQVYREESRVSQYGTKHVDPDTGIIYFKYDFGYEFGIIFPGEGHRIVAGRAGGGNGNRKHPRYTQNTAQFAAGDIEVPVQHERTRDYGRGAGNRSGTMSGPTPYGIRSASVPATEMHASARYGPVPFATHESAFHGGGSGRSTPSRGHSNRNSYCATPDPTAQGLNRSTTSTPNVKHQEEGVPTKTPLFVAPLKDIAVVSGQPARFECIVACDAAPSIRWTKNEAPIEEGYKFMPEYRNGVCRLSLPVAYEGDAGRYCCLAENHLGYAATCAELTVANSDWRANQ